MKQTAFPVIRRLSVPVLAVLSLASQTARADAFDPTQDRVAAGYAAPTAVVPSDTLAAMESVLDATFDSTTASPSYTTACPGGGSVTVTITGTLAGLSNGKPDTGETYALNFSNCTGAGSGVMNGSASVQFTLAGSAVVDGVTAKYAAGVLTLDAFSVTSPAAKQGQRLAVEVTGLVAFNYNETTEGTKVITSGVYAGNDVAVQVTNTAGNLVDLTVKTLNMSRQVLRQDGVLKRLVVSGEHALVTAAGRRITTAIQGSAQYSSAGTPLNGLWTVSTRGMALSVTVLSGTATIEVDKLADGSIDRTFTIPVSKLVGRLK